MNTKTINLLLAFLILCALTGIALEVHSWDAPKVDSVGDFFITSDRVETINGISMLRIALGPDCLKPTVRTIEWDHRPLEDIGIPPASNARLHVQARIDRNTIWTTDDALLNAKNDESGLGSIFSLDIGFPASFLTELRAGEKVIFRAGDEKSTAYRFSLAGSNTAINNLVETCFEGEWGDAADEWGV